MGKERKSETEINYRYNCAVMQNERLRLRQMRMRWPEAGSREYIIGGTSPRNEKCGLFTLCSDLRPPSTVTARPAADRNGAASR